MTASQAYDREAEAERAGKLLDEALGGPQPREGTQLCPRCGTHNATVWDDPPAPPTWSCMNCFAGMDGTGRPLWVESTAGSRPALEFLSLRELAVKMTAAGPRRFLLRGLWPAGDYGIHAAEAKAQKTWNGVDAAVAVASGTAFLGHVPVDERGPVLVLCGEGGAGNLLRRFRATAEARGLAVEDLPIVVCPRAPHLGDDRHIRLLAEQLVRLQPKLVVLDPLYLAAGGANLADLYAMGALLERPQHLCADVGAALWVTTHTNRKEGRGASRILGAGPAEWGRVLMTATVVSRRTDPTTRGTDVVTELDVVGGEIAGATLRLRRRIWADDPDDLDSPLHLEVSVEEGGDAVEAAADSLGPAAVKLLEALAEGPAEVSTLVDRIVARHGHGLKRETVSRNLAELQRRGKADAVDAGAFKPKVWRLTGGGDAAE